MGSGLIYTQQARTKHRDDSDDSDDGHGDSSLGR